MRAVAPVIAASAAERSSHGLARPLRLPETVIALSGPMIVLALCWFRSPALITTGRFWAEDSMFFGQAHVESTFLGKLAYIYKGHYELLPTLAHAVASYAPLKMQPVVTEAFGLAVEALLAFLLIRLRRGLGIGLAPALALCALLVVSPCASEHYLNVLNSQWLASALLFVLLIAPLRGLPAPAAAATGFVLGLTGVSTCALLPLAGLYAYARRSRPHVALAGGLLAVCVVQGLLVVTHPVESRFQPASPYVYVIAPLLQVGVKHVMGVDAENNLAEWFRNGPMAAGTLSPFVFLPLGILALMARRIARTGLSDEGLLLIAFLVVTALNQLGALGDRNNMVGPYMMRYFFLPSLIVGLLLGRGEPDAGRRVARHAALALALAVSTVDFFGNSYNASLVTLQHDWRRQVDTCRAKPESGPCSVELSPGGYLVDVPGGPS